MRLQTHRLIVLLPMLVLASCDHLPYDITLSAESLAEIRRGFEDKRDDFIVLHDMLAEDEISWLELHDSYWQIDDFHRSTPESEWSRRTEPHVYEQNPVSEVLARVGITEKRLLDYKELIDTLGIHLATMEENDIVFYIKSFESRQKDYLVEIIRTQDELDGTVVSSIEDMTLYADEDYYLPLEDDWYLHYRNYLPGKGVYARPRHPNGPIPLSR